MPILSDSEEFTIRPQDIDVVTKPMAFWAAFGDGAVENDARTLVRFCQARNSWSPFTLEEIHEFQRKGGIERSSRYAFGAILNLPAKLVISEGGTIYVTTEFVEKCHRLSPKV